MTFPVVFHFSAKMIGDSTEISFQEIQGIESQMETETIQAGGENSHLYYLPKKISHPDLVFKRALAPKESKFYQWCQASLERIDCLLVKPSALMVSLLDVENEPLSLWTFSNAYPVRWTLGSLDAMKNEILLETITFKYSTMTRSI